LNAAARSWFVRAMVFGQELCQPSGLTAESWMINNAVGQPPEYFGTHGKR